MFVRLSKMIINLEHVRLIIPNMVKPKDGENGGCTIYFLGSPESYAFYGEDEKVLMKIVKNNSYCEGTAKP